jgi:purine-binding chemotaxis protein CheW
VAEQTVLPVDGASAEVVLRERAEALASGVEQEQAADLLALLLFRIGEEWYAVRTGDVREIVQDLAVTALPCVPEYVLGVASIRGEIVSVTEPSAMFGLERDESARASSGPTVAVVLYNDQNTTALVVDEIGDIVDVQKGSLWFDDRIVGLVNVDRVLVPIDADAEG